MLVPAVHAMPISGVETCALAARSSKQLSIPWPVTCLPERQAYNKAPSMRVPKYFLHSTLQGVGAYNGPHVMFGHCTSWAYLDSRLGVHVQAHGLAHPPLPPTLRAYRLSDLSLLLRQGMCNVFTYVTSLLTDAASIEDH